MFSSTREDFDGFVLFTYSLPMSRCSHIAVLLAVCFTTSFAAAEDAPAHGQRAPLTYDARWTLHSFDPGVDVVADDEPVQRRRIRDDGVREVERSGSGEPGFFPEFHFRPPPPQASRPEQRSRNWIIPTLEGDRDDGPRLSRDGEEESETTGWGWLADEVEQRRRTEEERTTEQQAADEAVPVRREGGVGEGLISDRFFEAERGLQVRSTTNLDDRDLERLSGMSPDELLEHLQEQNVRGNGSADAMPDPWDERSASAAWLNSGGANEWSQMSAAELSPAAAWGNERNDLSSSWFPSAEGSDSLWSRSDLGWNGMSGTDSDSGTGWADRGSTGASGADRALGIGLRDSGRDGVTSRGQGTGMGFSPTEISGSQWGGDWSAGSDWQPDGGRTTRPAAPAREAGSAFSTGGSGWLASP